MLRGVTLKQLETFFWVAKLDSFSAAAARLNATQPAISNRIRELERVVGVELFDPQMRSPRVTPKGREILEVCERFLQLQQTLEEVAGRSQSIGGLVRVGAADTVALTWLPALISRLSEQHRLIDVELIVDLSVNLSARLADRDLDIAFLVGPIGNPMITTRPLGDVRNAWMCAPSLARRLGRNPQPGDMAKAPIFTHSRGSHLHQMVMEWFGRYGVRPARVHGCTSLSTMIDMTMAGIGLSVLPIDMLRREIERKKLRVLAPQFAFPVNRFLVAHQSTGFDKTVDVISATAIDLALESGVFLPPSAP